jgi:hypothetical protein
MQLNGQKIKAEALVNEQKLKQQHESKVQYDISIRKESSSAESE